MPHGRAFNILFFVSVLTSLPSWSRASDVGCENEDAVATSLLQVSVEHGKLAVANATSATAGNLSVAAINFSVTASQESNVSSLPAAEHTLLESARVEDSSNATAGLSQEQEYVIMTELARGVYTDEPSDVPGWTLLASYSVQSNGYTDGLHVYGKDGTCVVSFRGSDDPDDYASSIRATYEPPVEKCGSALHSGFWHEMVLLIQSPLWESSAIPAITGQCQTIYAVGHSLGGALAQIFAACANHQALSTVAVSAVTPLTVAKVYTFGAPAVSVAGRPLANAASPDGCFDGARFYNVDSWTYDPVPPLAQSWGLVHANIRPIQMYSSDSAAISVRYPGGCVSSAAWNLPLFSGLVRSVSLGWFGSISMPLSPTITDHQVVTYTARARTLWR
mmetsp:Transcript_27411/g.63319  ORF Transcript_27411/g.63319 Transcript_27411/m.63319 type:complete len:391 (-) Transcript_27411:69-1241(-)